ncbi:MAG: ferritin-like domain-containing protein [Actinomycetota bacterium]|nr:ferritin-like domain-containing protein [Actinomycetota bacterium]
MSEKRGKEKLTEYLVEARATELALARTLQAHIAMTPASKYRRGLERHLNETRDHAKRIERRAKELGYGQSLPQVGIGLAQTLFGQAFALTKAPLDLVRGDSGADKLVRNARDECASEALEIAMYDAIEEFARKLGDEETAELAASIRSDEERVLAELREAIPTLVDDVFRSEVEGVDTYDPSRTGAARDVKRATRTARKTGRAVAQEAAAEVRGTARQTRKVPGVARAEGELKGVVASASDLAIPNYDKLSAEEIVSKLPELSQIDLSKIDAYERRHTNRKTVLDRIATLRADEPWPGYDELTVDEVREVLSNADEQTAKKVADYERRHKQRQGVMDAVERELAHH